MKEHNDTRLARGPPPLIFKNNSIFTIQVLVIKAAIDVQIIYNITYFINVYYVTAFMRLYVYNCVYFVVFACFS